MRLVGRAPAPERSLCVNPSGRVRPVLTDRRGITVIHAFCPEEVYTLQNSEKWSPRCGCLAVLALLDLAVLALLGL